MGWKVGCLQVTTANQSNQSKMIKLPLMSPLFYFCSWKFMEENQSGVTKSLETVFAQQQRDSGSISLIKMTVFGVRNSKSRFQVVLKTHQSRWSQGLLVECGCASTLESHPVTPRHTWRHTDVSGWSLFTSLQRAPADHLRFHNPTVCMYEHALRPSIREPTFTRSKWLSTQSQEQLFIYAFMYVQIFSNVINEVCSEIR